MAEKERFVGLAPMAGAEDGGGADVETGLTSRARPGISDISRLMDPGTAALEFAAAAVAAAIPVRDDLVVVDAGTVDTPVPAAGPFAAGRDWIGLMVANPVTVLEAAGFVIEVLELIVPVDDELPVVGCEAWGINGVEACRDAILAVS